MTDTIVFVIKDYKVKFC